MRRIAVPVLAVASLVACSASSTPTETSGDGLTMTFSGAVAGTGMLSGHGAGHVCGREDNGAYLASMRTTLAGRDVTVQLQLGQYGGPAEYALRGADNSVTLTAQTPGSPQEGSPSWVSDDGRVTVDQADEFGGSIDAHLKPLGGDGPAVSMRGHWSCDRLVRATPTS